MSNVVEWTPLSSSQEKAIHRAACQIVLAAVLRETLELADPDLSGSAERPVMGVFVTLKRSGQLRGCIGSLAEYDVAMSGTHAEISVTESTVQPMVFAATLATIVRVSSSLSFGARSNSRRRLTIGMMAPRRLLTPST